MNGRLKERRKVKEESNEKEEEEKARRIRAIEISGKSFLGKINVLLTSDFVARRGETFGQCCVLCKVPVESRFNARNADVRIFFFFFF